MRALVTGASGFVGFNLALFLKSTGWDVLYTGRAGEQDVSCLGGENYLGYQFHTINWNAIGKVDVLFHQAAITDTTVYDKKLMMDVNLYQSLHLFDQAVSHGCKQIVYASSCAVYGDVKPPFKEDGPKNPLNVYGESKLRLDEYICGFGCNVVGLRYSNVYGRHEGHKGKTTCMVTQIGRQMLDGPPKLFQHGEQSRDFVYVRDVVNYNVAAASFQGKGVFNAGSGVATTFNDVVAAWNRAYDKALAPVYVPNPYTGKYQDHTLCDMSKTWDALKVLPCWSLDEAIDDYMDDIHDLGITGLSSVI